MRGVFPAVRHLMGDDEMMFGVHGRLDIIPNDPTALAAGGQPVRCGRPLYPRHPSFGENACGGP
jgi:hypothetical protein